MDGNQKSLPLDGKPKVDDSVLADLDYPEAKILSEYFLIQKRIAQIAEGNSGWLKVGKHGRIFHSVITNGTPSGRCRHHSINISQVPSCSVPYGSECRSLFHCTNWL